jgi:Zn-dependent protease
VSEPDERRGPEGLERPPGSFRLGTIAGSEVRINTSWFLIAALIAFVMGPRVDEVQPGLGAWKYLVGFVFAVLLYMSVLLHEASHAVMARRYGFQVEAITLHFLGGMTAIKGETRVARQEFAIAVVGPLTSIAVGGAALGLWFVTPDGLLRMAVEGLAGANLLIGALNLVPGLPLDGGRVLKAAVWGATGRVDAGTMAAAWGGRVVAVLALSWPLWQEPVFGTPANALDVILSIVVAAFLWSGATASMNSVRVRRKLPALVARDLARRTLAVPGDLPLAEAVRRAREAEAGGIVTVTTGGSPVGVVNEEALLATPEDRRPWVPVSTVARSLEEGLRLPVAITGEDLVRAINAKPATEYLLMAADGSIYGVLSTADVDRAFRDA